MLDTFRKLIQRSVFEALRLNLVGLGYTPDITTFVNTPEGFQDYNTALADIKQAKGFAAEIFNQSSPRGKGLKKVPRISLEYGAVFPGEWGSDGTPYPKLEEGSYKYYRDGLVSLEMNFICRVVVKDTIQERILNQTVLQTLPPLSYIPYYSDPTNSFFVRFLSYTDLVEPTLDTQEFVYVYNVPDINPDSPLSVGFNSVPITEINFEIQNHLGINQ